MDESVELKRKPPLNGQSMVRRKTPLTLNATQDREKHDDGGERSWRGLKGLLIAQIFGQFNDQAWKQLVILLAMAAVAGEGPKQERTAIVSMMLLVPLMIFSLPAGLVADRVSKRTVLIAMKALELVLMLAGSVALYVQPKGGLLSVGVLVLVGIQTAFFVPAKYGILPEILPYSRLSAGNGLLEMTSNLAILAGLVGGGILLYLVSPHTWLGGLVLSVLAAFGLLASLTIPPVKAARSEGGLKTTLHLASEAIRTDRLLRLAVIGQVFVWTIATLLPPVVLAYDATHLGLNEWQSGLPLAALGVGVGLGCLLAGKLSATKVEYGLLPAGSLGLTMFAFAFALIGPGLYGTIVLMTLLGVSSGLLFVPLNALLQWRAPADRRGAVIAMANLLAYAGMVFGTFLAMMLARFGVSGRGTFLAASVFLCGGFFWSLTLSPESFFRLFWTGVAYILYRLRVVGKSNIPSTGGALLVANHVSFADGLFIVASANRPVRFLIFANYFDLPLTGWLLRRMKAIPLSPSGGPKLILKAFREAGKALDEGELVCLFPEGQISRTGAMTPFQRGLERIVKGKTVPVIPMHLDRLSRSVLAPAGNRPPGIKFRLPVTVSIGQPLPNDVPLFEIRQAIRALETEAWTYRKADCQPLHRGFIRQARKHPSRLAFTDQTTSDISYIKALAGSLAIARMLKPRWTHQANVGVLLPASVGAGLVNLAATLAGKAVVNLNFTVGRAGVDSAVTQAHLKTVITSREFLAHASIEPPSNAELIYLEDVMTTITTKIRWIAFCLAIGAPARVLELWAGALRAPTADDTAAIIFTSGSTGDPKGVILSHFNIGANIDAIGQVFRVFANDRLIGVLPLFHSFGYTIFWFTANSGIGNVFHPSPLDAAAIATLVESYSATLLLATPTFLQLYMRRCPPPQFGSIRLVLAGAEKLPERMGLAFEDSFGIRPMEGYGITECSPVVAVNIFDYRAPAYYQPGSRRGYVGQPLPGVSVRIVSNETHEVVGPDSPGLVLVKGPSVMQGYLGRPDLTTDAFCDGWYNTGDQGLLSEDGFLKITGRMSRFSKVGGEMVPHGLVEESLQQASGVEEQAFAVTAIGDERKGEKLVVLHTLEDRAVDQTLRQLGSLGLPNLFIPRRENFVRVDKLPFLGTGKLDLREARRIAEQAINQRETVKA